MTRHGPAEAGPSAADAAKRDHDNRTALSIDDHPPPSWIGENGVLTGGQLSPTNSTLWQWRKLLTAAPHIGSTAKLVGYVIAEHCTTRDARAWPSRKLLQAEAILSKNSVIKATGRLEGAGFVTVERTKTDHGDNDSNVYALTWPHPFERVQATA